MEAFLKLFLSLLPFPLLSALRSRQYMIMCHFLNRERANTLALPFKFNLMPLPPPKTKSQWMKVRSSDWWERVVLKEFTDLDWKKDFRMTQSSFMKLCNLIEPYIMYGAMYGIWPLNRPQSEPQFHLSCAHVQKEQM